MLNPLVQNGAHVTEMVQQDKRKNGRNVPALAVAPDVDHEAR